MAVIFQHSYSAGAVGTTYNIFRDGAYWLRITDIGQTPLYTNQNFNTSTELYIYADGRLAYKLAPYSVQSSFNSSINASKLVVSNTPLEGSSGSSVPSTTTPPVSAGLIIIGDPQDTQAGQIASSSTGLPLIGNHGYAEPPAGSVVIGGQYANQTYKWAVDNWGVQEVPEGGLVNQVVKNVRFIAGWTQSQTLTATQAQYGQTETPTIPTPYKTLEARLKVSPAPTAWVAQQVIQQTGWWWSVHGKLLLDVRVEGDELVVRWSEKSNPIPLIIIAVLALIGYIVTVWSIKEVETGRQIESRTLTLADAINQIRSDPTLDDITKNQAIQALTSKIPDAGAGSSDFLGLGNIGGIVNSIVPLVMLAVLANLAGSFKK